MISKQELGGRLSQVLHEAIRSHWFLVWCPSELLKKRGSHERETCPFDVRHGEKHLLNVGNVLGKKLIVIDAVLNAKVA